MTTVFGANSRRYLLIGLIVIIGMIAVTSILVQNSARSAERPILDSKGMVLQDSYVVTGAVDGDLVIAADSVTFAEGSRVDGSVSVIGSSVDIGGLIEGNLTVFSDSLVIAPNATIQGDLSFIGSSARIEASVNGDVSLTADSITFSESARFDGAISACANNMTDTRVGGADVRTTCAFYRWFEPLGALIALRDAEFVLPYQTGELSFNYVRATPTEILIGGVLSSLFMAGIAGLTVTVFPRQISRIEEAIRSNPRNSGSVGLATFLLGFGITIAMIVFIAVVPPVGLLLLPIYGLAFLALLIFTFAGWVTLSMVIGDWITRKVTPASARLSTQRRITPPLVSAVIGSFALSLLGTLLSLLPLGGVIALAVLGGASSVGLGAALSTRMGTKSLSQTTFVQG